MENPEVTLAEYWRIIRKRKGTIFSVFLLVMISTVLFTKIQKPIYQASLEMRIEKKQTVSDLSNAEKMFESNSITNLTTEILLLKSLPVLKKVVEKLEVLPTDPDEKTKKVHTLSIDYQKRITAEQIKDTNIVKINVLDDNAQEAALTATAIADVYIVENLESRKRQAKAVIEYLDQQIKTLGEEIASEESKLQKFNQNEKVFEVDAEIKKVLDRMTVERTFEFESQLLVIEEEQQKLNEYIKSHEPNKISEILSSQTWAENFIFEGLKRRLLELEFERFLLLIDYTEKHPDVLQKDAETADIKNKIVNMVKSTSNIPMTLENEEYLAYLVKKLFADSRREVLHRIVNGFYGDENSLSTNQLEYVRLKRNIDRLLGTYNKQIEEKQEVKLSLAKVIDDVVTVVSPPVVPKNPIKPNAKSNYAVSCVIGLLLGIMFCFIRESLDSSIATIHDVEDELKLSMMGIIPDIPKEEVLSEKDIDSSASEEEKKLQLYRARLVTITQPKSWPAESIKMLRMNLIQSMKKNNYKTILFTSSDKQEGKSTVVSNLTLSMAQLGKKTILVGCNLRRPTDYKIFGLTRGPGVSDILMGNIPWKEAVRTSTDILTGGINIDHLLQMPGIDNLHIIPCGRPVENISEILNSKACDVFLDDLKKHYDVIIIDCSPVMAVPDAITLCSKVDGVVLIYKVGHTPKDILKRTRDNLIKANANILGIVLNDIKTDVQLGYSAYYYRYYAETPDQKKDIFGKWKRILDDKKHHARKT